MNFLFAKPIQNLNSGALAPLKNNLKKIILLLLVDFFKYTFSKACCKFPLWLVSGNWHTNLFVFFKIFLI